MMDRRRNNCQDVRLLLTAVLLFCLFLYQDIVDNQEPMPASISNDNTNVVVEKNEAIHQENATTPFHQENSPTPIVAPSSAPVMIEEEGKGINILCFGDSLTAGVLGIANKGKLRPYATFLQASLKKRQRESEDEGVVRPIQVNHTGLPGYTSYSLNHGDANDPSPLSRTIDRFQREDGTSLLDMVIIMAGTNDILMQSYLDYNVSTSVISMHQMVLYEHQIPLTIALDIPRTAAYEKDNSMLEQVDALSKGLKDFAESEPRTTFVPFPFPNEDNDEDWAKDGIHLKERGYKKLAKKLAPFVQQSLQDAGLW